MLKALKMPAIRRANGSRLTASCLNFLSALPLLFELDLSGWLLKDEDMEILAKNVKELTWLDLQPMDPGFGGFRLELLAPLPAPRPTVRISNAATCRRPAIRRSSSAASCASPCDWLR